MHYQFLTEDQSGGLLINELMTKLQKSFPAITFDIKTFQGIGHVPRAQTGQNAKQIKNSKLLNSLPLYLKGFDKSLQNISAALFIVLDNDERDTAAFQRELNQLAWRCKIATDCVFCIAVEEIEAWLLGDASAIFAAYPQLFQKMRESQRKTTKKYCMTKSTCGTWLNLAELLYRGGSEKLKKFGYPEIGIQKCEWAQRIGSCMDWNRNTSPSFQFFKDEVMKRLPQDDAPVSKAGTSL